MYRMVFVYCSIVLLLLLQTCQHENPVSQDSDTRPSGEQIKPGPETIRTPEVKNVTISEQVSDLSPVDFILADQRTIRSNLKSRHYHHHYYSSPKGASYSQSFTGIVTVRLTAMDSIGADPVFIFTITDSGNYVTANSLSDEQITPVLESVVCSLIVTPSGVEVRGKTSLSNQNTLSFTLPFISLLSIPSELYSDSPSLWNVDSIETGSSHLLRLTTRFSDTGLGPRSYCYLEGVGVLSIHYSEGFYAAETLNLIAVDDTPVDTSQFVSLGYVPVSTRDSLPKQIAGFSLISPQHLFAVGDGWAIRSTNAGDHWDAFTLPPATNPISVAFISESTGFLVHSASLNPTSQIMMTPDAGKTWRVAYGEDSPSLLECLGFQFTDSLHGFCMSRNAHLLTTVDGGLTWNSLGYADLMGVSVSSFFFNSSQNGWLVGDYSYVRRTTDGGQTWTVVNDELNLPNELTATFSVIVFTDNQTGYLYGSTYVNDTSVTRMLYRTTDGGSTWLQVHKSNEPAFSTICFKDPAHGIASDREGNIYTTSDSAGTWTPTSFRADGNVTRFSFADTHNGWARTSSGTLLRTKDGGTSWTALHFFR